MADAFSDQILVEQKLHSRTIVLNRPKQLNALSEFMISKIHELYLNWEKDDNVNVVVIKGFGRAFCSGGDVASVTQQGNAGQYYEASQYFWKEYVMNYVLATYKKPHVALLNGIVMGGGAGISMHGKFRVATEKTMFAMPETGLGLHPDVGASYFLSRLEGHLGEYIGLTGVRLDGPELLACGLATHFVHSERLPLLEELLSKSESSDAAIVSSIIDSCSEKVSVKMDSAFHRMDVIEKCFSKDTVEEILFALESEAKLKSEKWLDSSIGSIKKGSPTSLKITLRSIREGRKQPLHECLVREFRMSSHTIYRKYSNDFYEGCRAILLDKDRNPKWNPAKLHLVGEDMINHYFSPLDNGMDLELPTNEREPKSSVPVLSKI